MWMNFFTSDDKPLSPVEMLTLVYTTEDDYISATDLIAILDKEMGNHWSPGRGTIYPVLRRLVSKHFIVEGESSRKSYIRTQEGSNFIASMVKTLGNHQRSNFLYFNSILMELIKIDPHGTSQLLDRLLIDVNRFKEELEDLKKGADQLDEDEGWSDISIV